jgi:hypothetical protein
VITRICRVLKKLNSPKINDLIKKWATELNNFFKERSPNGKKHMKKCSPSLAIKEVQIKTTLKLHVTPVRVATTKNTTKNKGWRGCGEKGILKNC